MRVFVNIIVAILILIVGISFGHAQRGEPEFFIEITAPQGETFVRCVSGCSLVGSRDLGNPNAGKMNEYAFQCSGEAVQTCQARVAGWRE